MCGIGVHDSQRINKKVFENVSISHYLLGDVQRKMASVETVPSYSVALSIF